MEFQVGSAGGSKGPVKGVPQRVVRVCVQAVSGGQGLPVAVQCVALPWQDELCLRFMREVETLVRQKKK